MKNVFLSILIITCVHAGTWSNCISAIERLTKSSLVPSGIAHDLRGLDFDSSIPSTPLLNHPGVDAYHVSTLLPEVFTRVIRAIPEDPSLFNKYRNRVTKISGLSNSHPAIEILEHINRNRRGLTPLEYFKKAEEDYLSLSVAQKNQLVLRYQRIFLLIKARDYVRSLKVRLPIVREGQKSFLQVDENKYLAREKRDHWILTVPKDKVKTPAWNPLEKEKSERAVRHGQRPNVYTTSIDLDGFFYLQDGNHRFQLLENREFVKVKINKDRETGNLRDLIINLGGHDLSDDEYIRIYNGEDVRDVIDPALAARLIFDLH